MSYLSTIRGYLRKKTAPEVQNKPSSFIEEHLLKLEEKLMGLIKTSEESDYDFNEFEAKISNLEIRINEVTEEAYQSGLVWKIEELMENLTHLKTEISFFDTEASLDVMSPDKVDADFDEESMSYINEF